MNRPKKIISFLLAVLMAVSYVPVGAFALLLENVGEEHIHTEIAEESVPESDSVNGQGHGSTHPSPNLGGLSHLHSIRALDGGAHG